MECIFKKRNFAPEQYPRARSVIGNFFCLSNAIFHTVQANFAGLLSIVWPESAAGKVGLGFFGIFIG